MKKSIFFLAMLLPLGLLAQTDLIPLKRAKQVIVKTDVPAQEGYQLIIMALKENGYLLDQINESEVFREECKKREYIDYIAKQQGLHWQFYRRNREDLKQ